MMANNRGIYIHIPFCVRKCKYCAFLSAPADAETREIYVNSLVDEIKQCKVNFISSGPADTVYFGGGTPSVLTTEQIQRILDAVRKTYGIADDAEITLEANPATLGTDDEEVEKTLVELRNIGINRLSMGVQSLHDDVLSFIGRIHSAEDVRRDYRIARKVGFNNINLDLIFSLPGAERAQHIDDLKKLIEMKPEHISCYSLQIEEDTEFMRMFDEGLIEEVPDEVDRETYHEICNILKAAGYEHYEISNFALPGYHSRHNSSYWDMSEYIGLGLGASGFVGGVRYKNTDELGEYISGNRLAEEHRNTQHDNISEAVFTGLRRKEGIRYIVILGSKAKFWEYYAAERDEAERFVSSGHLVIDDDGIRITEKGIDISNKIMAVFV